MNNQKPHKELHHSTHTPGIAVLQKELTKSRILNSIDSNHHKHSGFKLSEIIEICVHKNSLSIPTLTETSDFFKESFEYPININRTTISRNLFTFGELNIHNDILFNQVKQVLRRFRPNPSEIRIIIDGTTIEVSKNSTYECASWVWDNAQGKSVWGYEITIILISFGSIFFPIYFQIGEPNKIEIVSLFQKIRSITKSNKVLFDAGYACDLFYEALSDKGFVFYSKVPKSWIYNNGLSENVCKMKSKLRLKKKQHHKIVAYRVKGEEITDFKYALSFKGGDPRHLISNDLKGSPQLCFLENKKRWDIETCNAEIKENFCFEKLPIRKLSAIKAYLFTCLIALNLVNIIKYKHRKSLRSLFNKGFKRFIRLIIKAQGVWSYSIDQMKLVLNEGFKYKWFYERYDLT